MPDQSCRLPLRAALPCLLDVAVGHAGNVIGDRAGQALCGNLRLVVFGQQAGVVDEGRKKLIDDFGGMNVPLLDGGRIIEIGV